MFDDLINAIKLNGLIPIMKFNVAELAVPTCKAVQAGGLNIAEITFRTAAAAEAIRQVRLECPDMLVGAGTVTKIEQAEQAVDLGVKFIVTPGFNPHVVEWCVLRNIPVIPGINDPSSIELAMEFGLNCLKFFPAEVSGGTKFIKAVRGPYGNISFVPTGGINQNNFMDYLRTPGIVACGGSWMVPNDAIEDGEYEVITDLVRKAIDKMLDFEIAQVCFNAKGKEEMSIVKSKFGGLASLFNIMKNDAQLSSSGIYQNSIGKIDIKTENLDRAMYYLTNSGIHFKDKTKELDNMGNVKSIIMENDIAGFLLRLIN